MQSPPKPIVFESDIAPLLSAFVVEKQRMGFKYNTIAAYLKSFDTYLLDKSCKDALSKELMLDWVTPKPHQTSTTVEHHIHIMQRLADFLNRNGFSAYRIPSELIPKKTHHFTPYVFSYEEIASILTVVDGFEYNKTSSTAVSSAVLLRDSHFRSAKSNGGGCQFRRRFLLPSRHKDKPGSNHTS